MMPEFLFLQLRDPGLIQVETDSVPPNPNMNDTNVNDQVSFNSRPGTSTAARLIQSQISNNPNTQIQLQDDYLHSFGFQRHISGMDGNCLFRSVSFALSQSEENHGELRNAAVGYMRDHFEMFHDHFLSDGSSGLDQDTFNQMLENLGTDGTWVGQESIIALCFALDIDIVVIHGGYQYDNRVQSMFHSVDPEADPDTLTGRVRIYISYSNIGGGHYDAVAEHQHDDVPLIHVDHNLFNDLTVNSNFKVDEYKQTRYSKLYNPGVGVHSKLTKQSENSEQGLVTNECMEEGDKMTNLKCQICSKIFQQPYNLKRHLIKVHKDQSVVMKPNKSFNICIYPSCNEKFNTMKCLLKHMEGAHSQFIKKCDLTFDTMSEFKVWKEKEEIDNNIFFGLNKGCPETKTNIKTFQYVCNRHGNARVRASKSQAHVSKAKNMKGSCKLNRPCPSRLYVKEHKDKHVTVEYIQTHSHSLDFDQSKYLRLPKSKVESIKEKFALGIPTSVVIEDLTKNIGNLDDRNLENLKYYQLASKGVLNNIRRKLSEVDYKKHDIDAVSVQMWINELKLNSETDPILLFKPQYSLDPTMPLSKDDFMIVIMTNEQAEMYNKFAERVLCIDATHNTNMYSFQLITLMVIDEFRKGYPVAFCISSREDTHTISIFLDAVKKRCPNTPIKILISDNDHCGINAAKATFGPQIEHYLCIWHVLKKWKTQLPSKIINKDHKKEIYHYLYSMLFTKTEEEFSKLLSSFTQKFSTLEPKFYSYFQSIYLTMTEKWSLHLRKKDFQTELTTNNFIESFHNQLKTHFFNRKQNKRLDRLLYTLLKVEKHYFLNHVRLSRYHRPENVCYVSNRHENSLGIEDSFVEQINENTFLIKSSRNQDELYLVHRIGEYCLLSSCFKKCNKLPCNNLCEHLYTCSCLDTDSICKHVHKVHSISKSFHDPESQDDTFELVHSEPLVNRPTTSDNLMSRFQTIMKEIDSHVKSNDINPESFENGIINLEKMLISLKANTNLQTTATKSMNPVLKVSSNQNFEKQPNFKKMKKSHTKTNHLKAPTTEERQQLLRSCDEGLPSVAEYPPMEYVSDRRQNINIHHDSPVNDPFINPSGGVYLDNNYLIPPDVENQPIQVTRLDGKRITIKVVSSKPKITNKDNLEDL